MADMREIMIDKVTVNIAIGQPGDGLDNAKVLLERLTGRKPIETTAKKRNPVFKLRVGLPIGTKVTLRGKDANEFVEKALAARKKMIKASSFDRQGNVAFGVAEYIDFPGAKYDPDVGMLGFDVCLTLSRKGKRVGLRRIKKSKLGRKHGISREEAQDFMKNVFGAKIE